MTVAFAAGSKLFKRGSPSFNGVLEARLCNFGTYNLPSFIPQYINIQGVTGGTDQTPGECSLGHTIPI